MFSFGSIYEYSGCVLCMYVVSLCVPDVVSIEKTNELFRLIYDVKGRFTVHRITPEEAKVHSIPHYLLLVDTLYKD